MHFYLQWIILFCKNDNATPFYEVSIKESIMLWKIYKMKNYCLSSGKVSSNM